jgi:hypothetical protein
MKNSPWTLAEGRYVAEASSLGLKPGQTYPITHPTKPQIKFGLSALREIWQHGELVAWKGYFQGVALTIFNE